MKSISSHSNESEPEMATRPPPEWAEPVPVAPAPVPAAGDSAGDDSQDFCICHNLGDFYRTAIFDLLLPSVFSVFVLIVYSMCAFAAG